MKTLVQTMVIISIFAIAGQVTAMPFAIHEFIDMPVKTKLPPITALNPNSPEGKLLFPLIQEAWTAAHAQPLKVAAGFAEVINLFTKSNDIVKDFATSGNKFTQKTDQSLQKLYNLSEQLLREGQGGQSPVIMRQRIFFEPSGLNFTEQANREMRNREEAKTFFRTVAQKYPQLIEKYRTQIVQGYRDYFENHRQLMFAAEVGKILEKNLDQIHTGVFPQLYLALQNFKALHGDKEAQKNLLATAMRYGPLYGRFYDLMTKQENIVNPIILK